MRWAGVIAVLAFVIGCSGSGDDDDANTSGGEAEPPAEISGHEVLTETFVDTSRPTSASAEAPAADTRTLETLIAYPTPLDGQYPLVVLGHGLGGHPARLSELMGAWAEAGYIVAAPAFPRTNDARPGGAGAADYQDLANQPADVSFVIDSMLELAADDGDSPVSGHVDTDRIGLAGHSLGGATAVGTVFNTCCADERIDAVELLAVAPPELFGLFGGELDLRPVPTLMVVADGDFVYQSSEAVYPMLGQPKWYVTLHGEDNPMRHVTPYEDPPDPSDDLVKEVTTAFWDLELKDDTAAQARMEEAAQPADGSATIQSDKE
jgi:dienelactone hydrolase